MEDIDVDGLAEAVFQSVGTNTSLLLMDPESEDSIWGSVLLKWGKAINAATRISCRNLWFKNSGNVQVRFIQKISFFFLFPSMFLSIKYFLFLMIVCSLRSIISLTRKESPLSVRSRKMEAFRCL